MTYTPTHAIAVAAVVLVVAVGLWVWLRPKPAASAAPAEDEALLFKGAAIDQQPLLSEAALSLYNLIKLAVEDRYLVFAQVPVWALVGVRTADPTMRTRLLRKLALRRVDIALMHPGTRKVQTAVFLDGEARPGEARRRADGVIRTLLHGAGIAVVRLDATKHYSVSTLAEALGLQPPDDESGG